MTFRIIILWMGFVSLLPAQTLTLPLTLKILSLPKELEARGLAVDEERNVFVLSPQRNQLTKYLARNHYDSTIAIGGAGIDGTGFSQPVLLRVPNRLTTFVLDYGNQRIVLLDDHLQLLDSRNFGELPLQTQGQGGPVYISPQSFDVSATGELFVLSQQDNQVYKFDAYGKYQLVFGGLSYGTGRLLSPTSVAVIEGKVYVADTLQQQVQVYDNLGNFQYTLRPGLSFHWGHINLGKLGVIYWSSQKLAIQPFLKGTVHEYESIKPIHDLCSRSEGVYMLSGSEVNLYSF